MCGIVGGFGKLSETNLCKMIDVIAHRGPDNKSYEIINNVHLGYVRLSVIDLSEASNQPLWDINKKACIIFNGEIYNYKALRSELEKMNYIFKSHGDAEVLLNLYLEYGVSIFNKIEGMFAFVIWDTVKEELLVARDHYGIKPLYYCHNEDGFYFASEIKALLQIDNFNKSINYDALLRTLTFLWSPGEETLLSAVKKVKPGHYLVIKNGQICENVCYWQWPEYKPIYSKIDESVYAILQTLQKSVKDQLVADVPVGAFLSGGLDSSLIVALAKRAQEKNKRFECFTIDLNIKDQENEGFADDLPYAEIVAKALSIPLYVLNVNPDIVELLPKMVYHLDELQADPASINVLLIAEEAKKHGIKVLLSGTGGDDLFTGYRRHFAVNYEKLWIWLPSFLKRLLGYLIKLLPKGNTICRRVSKLFQYADLPENERILSYFYWIDPQLVKDLFVDEIKEKLSNSPMDFMLQELISRPERSPVEKMLYLERSYFMVDHNLNYTDKMSMACGIEVRLPFLNRNVVTTASMVDVKLKQKGSIGKWILKKAAEKLLPNNIIYRPKTGFGVPLRIWLKKDLTPIINKYLNEECIKTRGIFKPEKIQHILRDVLQGKADYTYTIFALICFEMWCQIFIDNKKDFEYFPQQLS